jgi:hypothetical protein
MLGIADVIIAYLDGHKVYYDGRGGIEPRLVLTPPLFFSSLGLVYIMMSEMGQTNRHTMS